VSFDRTVIMLLGRIERLEQRIERMASSEAPHGAAVWLGTATGGATMDFANISQGYRSLAISLSSCNTVAATSILCRCSSDGTTFDLGGNYDWQWIASQAATVTGGELFGHTGLVVGRHGVTATLMSPSWILFPDYANATEQKTAIATYGSKEGTATGNLRHFTTTSYWRSTAPIKGLRLLPTANAFTTESRATLYGIP
jgi:hypothetical protein